MNSVLEFMRSSRGIFSAVKFDKKTTQKIVEFQKINNVKNPISQKDLHTTIIFSPDKYILDYPIEKHLDIKAKVVGFEKWRMNNGNYCLVVLLDCDFLNERFEKLSKQFGIKNPYDEYKPHVTLSYDVPKYMNVSNLKDNIGELRIISEYVQDHQVL